MKKSDQDTIMKFPCQFPIKVMGMASDDFDTMVVEIIKKHVTELPKDAAKSRLSQEGNYVAVTVTIEAESRQQLDNIYLDLTEHKKVLMAL
jgi:putative lipoic acid-binding regulatory protein|tara:strand:- start:106 stop:378 length:273 start_codon:yes stop_codon:yes gene_type:complete